MVGLRKSDCRFAIDGLDRFDLQDVAVETLAIAEAVTLEAFWGRAFLMPAATCKARVQTLVRDSSPQAPSRPHLTNCKRLASDSMHKHQYIHASTHMRTYMYRMYMYMDIHVVMYMYMYRYMYTCCLFVCMYVCMYVWGWVWVWLWVCVCGCVWCVHMHIHRRTLRADCPSLFANFYLHACAVVQTDSFPFINSIGWHTFGEIAKYSFLPTFVTKKFLAKGLICQTRIFTNRGARSRCCCTDVSTS